MDSFLKIAVETSLLAGQVIMDIYDSENYSVQNKDNQTPVTEADYASHEVICKELATTGYEVLSEEGDEAKWAEIKTHQRYWLIDPLDGTKEFIHRNGEFTVNVALIENGKPILGVIYIPVQEKLYAGIVGENAWRWEGVDFKRYTHWSQMKKVALLLPISENKKHFRVLGSKSFRSDASDRFMNELEDKVTNLEIIRAGSSIKFCLIASGEADLYPRLDSIMEWDVAAGHAIVEASGGTVLKWPTEEAIHYSNLDMRFPHFVATTKNVGEWK